MLYGQLRAALDTAKDLASGKPYGNNTKLCESGVGIAVRLYNTDILKVYPGNTLVLDSNGWKTAAARNRLNKLLRPYGICIIQHKYVWYVHRQGIKTLWQDGMTIAL